MRKRGSAVFPKVVWSWNPLFLSSNRYLWAKGSAERNLRSVAFDIHVLTVSWCGHGDKTPHLWREHSDRGSQLPHPETHPRIRVKAMPTRGCSSRWPSWGHQHRPSPGRWAPLMGLWLALSPSLPPSFSPSLGANSALWSGGFPSFSRLPCKLSECFL